MWQPLGSRADAPGKELERDAVLLELMPDGVLICDGRGQIEYVNPRFEELSGYSKRALVGKPLELLLPDGEKAAHRRFRVSYMQRPRTRPMGSVERDYRLRRRDGRSVQVDIALAPVSRSGSRHVIAVVRDITARKELEARLEHQALHDPLTGLANRALFLDRMRQGLLQGRRDRSQLALVLLDLDNFKAVNDAHGHQVGDRVLERIARALACGLRATDTVARIGGDEFAWVLPGVGGRQAALIMMAKLLQAVPARVTVQRRAIEVGVSAGLALSPEDGEDIDTLMRVADVRLYASKRRVLGRDYRRLR